MRWIFNCALPDDLRLTVCRWNSGEQEEFAVDFDRPPFILPQYYVHKHGRTTRSATPCTHIARNAATLHPVWHGASSAYMLSIVKHIIAIMVENPSKISRRIISFLSSSYISILPFFIPFLPFFAIFFFSPIWLYSPILGLGRLQEIFCFISVTYCEMFTILYLSYHYEVRSK
jgi:hypothetical protein